MPTFKSLLSISLILLIALNLYLIKKYQYIKTIHLEQVITNTKLEKAYEIESNINANTSEVLMKMILSEGTEISKKILLTDINSSQIPITQLVSGEEVKIYYIPEHACDVCYDYLTDWLKKLSKDDQKSIITFCPNNKIRDITSYFEEEGISSTVYGIDGQLNLIPANGHVPFFFKMDKYFKCQNILVPIKEKPAISTKYLSTVF